MICSINVRSVYDGMTTVYALARPPDFKTFETIKKV